MAQPILDLEALLKVPYVDPYMGFDISLDSRYMAFSWNPTGRWEIYTLPLDGLDAALREQGPDDPQPGVHLPVRDGTVYVSAPSHIT